MADVETVQGETQQQQAVRAWDVPTRLFHWTLVLLIISAYVTRQYGGDDLYWHKVNGYAVLTLVLWRLIWGFVGGSTARFSAFVRWPWKAAGYGLQFLKGEPPHYLGHNPLGGLVVVAMLAALTFQGVSGLFSNDDILAEGPLVGLVSYDMSAFITRLHLQSFDILLALIALHVTANFLYLFWKKINLIKPMLSGVKEPMNYEDESEARYGSPARAVLSLAAAAAIVLGSVTYFGGSLF